VQITRFDGFEVLDVATREDLPRWSTVGTGLHGAGPLVGRR